MKVLLRSDIDGVGKRGDIIDVSGGFARNHLLPAGKAIVASPGVEGQAAAMRQSRDLRDARDRESSETVARTLVGNTITMPARAERRRLFGSVSAADIVRQVEEQTGAIIDRKDLVLDEPIKTVGEHNVRVELIGGVVFELTVDGRRGLTGSARPVGSAAAGADAELPGHVGSRWPGRPARSADAVGTRPAVRARIHHPPVTAPG